MQIELGYSPEFHFIGIYPELNEDQEKLINNSTDYGDTIPIQVLCTPKMEKYSTMLFNKKYEINSSENVVALARQIARVFRSNGEIVQVDEIPQDIEGNSSLFNEIN
jgi:hypothetical protein